MPSVLPPLLGPFPTPSSLLPEDLRTCLVLRCLSPAATLLPRLCFLAGACVAFQGPGERWRGRRLGVRRRECSLPVPPTAAQGRRHQCLPKGSGWAPQFLNSKISAPGSPQPRTCSPSLKGTFLLLPGPLFPTLLEGEPGKVGCVGRVTPAVSSGPGDVAARSGRSRWPCRQLSQ